ncbi:MAG: SDR family NAD(P)-dependent oxidoreductase [Bacteroides graminisolvens]|nr:SDR family NAD(P)-dependent oxidoreductase [Bacteroides graminisolvens]
MKKVIIIGATSGIGEEIAKIYIAQGWQVGIAGRREEALTVLAATAPAQVKTQVIDVTSADAPEQLKSLIEKLGGMDLFLLSSGIGSQNVKLEPEIELNTARTNVEGFIRMVTTAYRFFKEQGSGHLAVISSVAGTKGLGSAPAYSATKRFQNTYIDALAQLARMERLSIQFTDIRPGFVATALLKNRKYPLLMRADSTAQHIVKALANKKRVAIIDTRYAILVFFWQLIPRWLWERLPIRNDKS